MAKRVLICGETWMTSSTHVKGFDSFSACTMDGGVRFLDFGIDPSFGNCVDGLIRVDLACLKPAKRARYIDQGA